MCVWWGPRLISAQPELEPETGALPVTPKHSASAGASGGSALGAMELSPQRLWPLHKAELLLLIEVSVALRSFHTSL